MANEKRLIDANALSDSKWWESLTDDFDKARARIIVMSAPTVDAVEVVHGRWEPHYETFDADMAVGILGGNYQTGWQCSVCGRYESSKEPYCNCGAKMDGDGNG